MKNFFRFGFVIFFAVAAVFATEIPPEQNFYIKTDRAEINFSHARDGFISARFLEDTDKIVKILIENENKNRYQYYLNTEKSWEIFPLSEGDGIYSVGIFEQVHGNFFSHAASAKIEVVLRDEFAPFLRANQFVNFCERAADEKFWECRHEPDAFPCAQKKHHEEKIFCEKILCEKNYCEKISCEKISCEKISCEKIRCEKIYCKKIYCEKISCEKIYCEKIYCEKISCEKISCEKISCEKISCATKKISELVFDSQNDAEKIEKIFSFVTENFEYDFEFAKNVRSDYVPDIDAVFARQKGICFDFSALTVAALRSQNIPAKLVVGYAGEIFHTWTSVFFDGEWRLFDPTFSAPTEIYFPVRFY